jgi:iron complex outermembrane receptor protein
MRSKSLISITFRCAGVLALATLVAKGQAGLGDASLEQLLNVEVTSVSKKEQKLSRTAAAVFVIGHEDIRRSGAQNLPDLLRMAPGVEVAQIDANAWAITIRGFNSRFSNKVLVLVDGRSVYTPSFSGVYWDQLDMPLEDIERIEVIRGPGATVWGANAVNGVINIITRSSKATQGGLASASVSSGPDSQEMLRYGGTLASGPGASGTYRAFARYSRIADGKQPDGTSGLDDWSRVHGGFRSDWDLSARDSLTVQGDLFSNRGSQVRHQWFYPSPSDPPFAQTWAAAGGNLLSRWNHTSAGGSDMSLQAYYDTYRRDDLGLPESEKTFDLDFRQHVAAGSRHDIVFGAGYRMASTIVPPGYQISLTPAKRTDSLYNTFIQDEIRVAYRLWLTLGTKVEHNAYTGFEYEPSARLAWAPTPRQTFWGAASRAIRQPSREETGVNAEVLAYPLGPYTMLETRVLGNPRFRSEELRDYEVGYRAQWTKSVSLDVTAFLSFYRHLGTVEPQAPVVTAGPAGVVVTIPVLSDNQGYSTNYGSEVALNWKANSRWRVEPGYSFLRINAHVDPTSGDTSLAGVAGNSPPHTFQVRSFLNLSSRLQWDHTLYWMQKLPTGSIPSYARLDSRLAWKLGESTEISLVGQNLLRPGTVQFGDTFNLVGTPAQRSVFGKITWSF